jgi:hypothetical protein
MTAVAMPAMFATVDALQTMLANADKLRQSRKGKDKEQLAEIDKQRKQATQIAYALIFDIFDRKSMHYAGDALGIAVKGVLKAKYGGGVKHVKCRTVSEQMLADISPAEVLAHLEAWKKKAHADIDAEGDTMREAKTPVASKEGTGAVIEMKPTHTEEAITVHCNKKKEKINNRFEAAQNYANIFWAQIPAAMKLIKIAGDGTVKTTDGEIKPVALAFEMMLLNRAETASQFAKVVAR